MSVAGLEGRCIVQEGPNEPICGKVNACKWGYCEVHAYLCREATIAPKCCVAHPKLQGTPIRVVLHHKAKSFSSVCLLLSFNQCIKVRFINYCFVLYIYRARRGEWGGGRSKKGRQIIYHKGRVDEDLYFLVTNIIFYFCNIHISCGYTALRCSVTICDIVFMACQNNLAPGMCRFFRVTYLFLRASI